MDCDDVMLALANRERTLTDQEGIAFHRHLEGCEDCRALAVDQQTAWRWIARLPEDAFDGDLAMVLPTVDPVVFEIDQEIAAGGMGRITKATDRRLGREVALKEVLDQSYRARFEREAMITARLQHPAIVPIYEAGTFPNGNPFYTMRLVWGGTLGNAIELAKTMEKRLALLPHVIAVTDALAYAHDNQIIHRDLKPGNVLVGEFGETVVIDWGLAKDLSSTIDVAGMAEAPIRTSSPKLTRVGAVLGTPGFMSPEQASGGSIDERADVYALGAILYNLLAGAPPYWDTHAKEGSTELIAHGIEQPPTPIGERAPEAPADLRTIVEKAMSRRKEDRYPSAKEMAKELRRFAAGQLIQREYSLRELIGRWIKKHRTAVSVGAIAFVALAVVIVLAFLNITRSRGAEREARRDAEQAQQEAIAQRDTAQRTAAELQEDEGIRELGNGDGSRAYAHLVAAFSPQRAADPAYQYLVTAASRDLALEVDHVGNTREVAKAIGFVGDRLVLVDAVAHTLVIRRDGRSESVDLGPAPILRASFAPGGGLVELTRSPAKLEVRDLAGTLRLEVPGVDASRVVIDELGRRVAIAAGNRLLVYELAPPGQPAKLLLEHPLDEIRDLAIDTVSVAACTRSGVEVHVFEPAGGAPARLAADCSLVAFLDAKQLVIVHDRYELRRWTVGAPAADKTMSGHIPINVLAVNKAAQRIATGDATGVVMWRWDGTALGESRDITGGIDKLMFTTDGKAFVGAGADDRVFVWDTGSFHLRQAFGGKRGAVTAIAVDAVNQRIASLSEYRAQVWAMPKGRLLLHVPSRGFAIAGVRLLTSEPPVLESRSLIDLGGSVQSLKHGIPAIDELVAGPDLISLRGSTGELVTIDTRTYSMPPPFKPSATISLSASPRFVVDVQPTRVLVREILSGTPIQEVPVTDPRRAIVSPDGAQLAIVLPRRLEWVAVANNAAVASVELPEQHTYEGKFDPAGRALVLYGRHLPTLLVTAAGSRTLTTDAATGAVWSGDGKWLALGVSRTVQLWDVAANRPQFTVGSTLRDHYAITRTGTLLATGSIDGSIRIWDNRGRLLDRLVGSQQTIKSLVFALDDTRLVAQSEDQTLAVWDVHIEPVDLRRIDPGPWKLEGAQLVPAVQ